MSKRNFILTVLVLVAVLLSSTLAQASTEARRRSYWSDLDPDNHDWNEPNNWWTLDVCWEDDDGNNIMNSYEDYWYEKTDQNEVPDINTQTYIGKGEIHQDYPSELKDYWESQLGNYRDPIIESGTFDANHVMCGGGTNIDSTGDPNAHHYLTVTGGTLNVGEPNLWENYREHYYYSPLFRGQWENGRLCIGMVRGGTGTMNMTGGVVNIGGHMEVGAWGGTGELHMDGGEINIMQGFYCTSALWGGVGRTYLRSGTINAGYLDMITMDVWTGDASSSGTIDFAGGIMKLDGKDEVEIVEGYVSGDEAGAAITAYGVQSGEIVTDTSIPEDNKRAFLNIAYTIDGKTTIHAVATEPAQAWGPIPADGSADVIGPSDDVVRLKLEWSPGDGVFTHDVYFGTDFNEVNDADPNVFMATLPQEDVNCVHDEDLKSLTTYYWRIDEFKKPSTLTKGQVWTFKTADFTKASHPNPHDNATNVFPPELTWTPGIYADTHDVYFSSDFNDVNDRLGDCLETVLENVYITSDLKFDTTYYWRVDEVNGLDVWDGHLWTFTITDHMHIDDMESYESSVKEIFLTWKDWQENLTGAEVFPDTLITTWESDRSMRFLYANEWQGGVYYSEAEADIADLEIGPDWTVGGAEAVVINFYGKSSNLADANNQMYFAAEDGDSEIAVITYPDVTDLQEPEWHEWNISLQQFIDEGVDVTDVAKVYIGFGDRTLSESSGNIIAAPSTVYFDDLEVRPRRCTAVTSLPYGDLNGDCMVDNNDLAEMVTDWLVVDYNTVGFHAELWNFPEVNDVNNAYDKCWVTGQTGLPGDNALEFGFEHPRDLNEVPTSDDFVVVPPLNWYSNTMTVTAWVKIHGLQRDDSAIFYCDGKLDDPIWESTTVAGFNLGCGNDNSLGYNWPTASGAAYSWDPDIAVLQHDEWAFCALVVAPETTTIYIKPQGEELDYKLTTAYTHLPEKFDIPSTIGFHKWRTFDGVIDDLRIFKDPLPHEQIEWLANDGAPGDPNEPNTPYIWYKFDESTGLVAEDSGEGALMYHPNPSKANLYEDEPMYQRYVNLRDYS
ncbi:MAG: LamG domain-containing protein, partial [Sedimentisphaerales bacterium]|nr:LamG domain-containing protein [Sedimentisphaerales bacterium]